ncbi:MAG: cyclic nucleotide-binding domain-containing protein [Myxococcales bacterium]|nr:cyclic nucleotide-binding domain-containing protein [Myxococcota bacterium]MDW8280937.1 cyclic nucleotide-binding domain-containing protein [Myxococcales bacterium]
MSDLKTAEGTATPADEAEGLAATVELLEADPGNLWAWLRVAWRLYDDPEASPGERAQARQALDNVAAALGEAGHLPLALVACCKLAEAGEARTAWARLMALSNAYSRTSTRVDPTVRPRPPAPPRPASGQETSRPEGPVLRVRAVAALRKAAAHAISEQQKAVAQGRLVREPLPSIPLLSALQPDAFVKLAQRLKVVELPVGARVFSAGQTGEALFIVARGTVRIEREDGTVLSRLRAGAFFGEMALLTGARRSAHAVAETPVLLLRAERADLEELADRDPAVAEVLAEHARWRLLQNLMVTSQLFRVVGAQAREQLMARFSFRRYEPGEVIIQDGQPGSELLVLLSGRAEVARREAPGSNVLVPVAVLSMGDVMGEMSLLWQRPTAALVHALEATTVLALRREDFVEVIAQYPEVRDLLQQVAAQREHAAVEDIAARVPALALREPELLFDEEHEVLT